MQLPSGTPSEADVAPQDHYPGESPEQVALPVMTHDWTFAAFLHWRYDPAVVREFVPDWLEVDTYDGSAWVGLVPFYMRIQVGPVPPIPYATIFPETNVRTYARGPDGRAGVWFLSLDVPRLSAVLGARVAYGLPYKWSSLNVLRGEGRVAYQCRRFWPSWPLATSSLTVGIGEEIPPDEVSELEHFLTARWRLFTRLGNVNAEAPVEHPMWPLFRAEALELMDSLVTATGLPPPEGEPLVHYSPGVRARIGLPRPIGS